MNEKRSQERVDWKHLFKNIQTVAEICDKEEEEADVISRKKYQLEDFLRSEYSKCCMCEGYFGNNFGQPVCSTCHLFLFSCDETRQQVEKCDSGDSGNEEPTAESEFYMLQQVNAPGQQVNAPSQQVNAPIQQANAPSQQANAPSQQVNAPSQQLNSPSQQVNSPIQQLNSPSQQVNAANQLPSDSGDSLQSSLERVRLSRRELLHSGAGVERLVDRVNQLSNPRDYSIEKMPTGLFNTLPPEVMLSVFQHLDDISLLNAGRVCTRWNEILDAAASEAQWEKYVYQRWPLFTPRCQVHNWKLVYTKLLESAPCLYCLDNMMLQSSLPIEENSWRHRRLRSELKTLRSDPPEGIQASPLDQHCCHWQASITGPHGSPFEGGLFLLYLQIPSSYPMRPPLVRFITKVFHPNVSRHGDVGLDSIQHNWSLALTISKVLVSVQSLLTDPFCKVCMEPAIAELYRHNRKEFNRIARLWTWKYTMHDFVQPCDISLDGD